MPPVSYQRGDDSEVGDVERVDRDDALHVDPQEAQAHDAQAHDAQAHDVRSQKQATGDRRQATGDAFGRLPQSTGDRRQATGDGQLEGRVLGRGADIAERLLDLAAAVLRSTRKLSKDAATRHVVLQLARAVTAGGANYEEARAAESRNDFIHKLGIALKEIRETIFWLRLLERTSTVPLQNPAKLVRECTELAAILGASIRTARSRAER